MVHAPTGVAAVDINGGTTVHFLSWKINAIDWSELCRS